MKGLKLDLPNDFIALLALNSLSPNFSQIKTAYNIQNATWSINDLIAKCDAEQKKLRREKGESALLVSQPKPNPNLNHDPKKDRSKFKPNHYAPKKTQVFKRHEYGQARKVGGYDVVQKCKVKYFFFHKDGHKKSECRRFSAWLEK